MPLRKQKVSIPFVKGLQQKISGKVLPREHLQTLINGRFSKVGAVGKRLGYRNGGLDISDIVAYKDTIICRDISNGGIGGTYSSSHQASMGDLGFSEGLDYSLLPVSKGSEYGQYDSNVSMSSDGKYACITYVEVKFDPANENKRYNKRFSIISREHNTFLVTDMPFGNLVTTSAWVHSGSETFTGNNGRRMQSLWLTDDGDDKEKVYIWAEDEGALKGWKIDPTENPIVVRNFAGTETYDGTTILSSTAYPLVVGSAGDGYPTSLASFSVTTSSTETKAHLFATITIGGSTYRRYYLLSTSDHSHTLKASEILSGAHNAHIYIHRALVTGANANKLYFASHEGTSLFISVMAEEGTSFTTTQRTITGITGNIRGAFYDVSDSTPDVDFLYEENIGIALGSAGRSDIKIIREISNGSSFTPYLICPKQKLVFAFNATEGAEEALIIGTVHDDNPEAANYSEAPINTIQIWEIYRYGTSRPLPSRTFDCWVRDSLPTGTFKPLEYMSDTIRTGTYNTPIAASGTDIAAALAGRLVAVPVGSNFEKFGATGGTVALNSTATLVDIRTRDRVDLPAASSSMLHDILYVADGNLFQFDGQIFRYLGFYDRPMFRNALGTTGGNLTASSVYFYKVVYEWIDGQGNLHQSEPSTAVSITTEGGGGKHKVNLSIVDYNSIDYNNATVKAAIYRTLAGGFIYYNIATIALNDLTNATGLVAFVDDIGDVNAATGKTLYTDAGELANIPPPTSARYVLTHRNRLFVIGKDDIVYYSKLAQDGYGVGFNSALQIKTPDNISDPPTALGSMDGNLFVFTRYSIFVISGEGPDNAGLGGFYDAKKIPTNVGALKGSPVKLISGGLLFVSDKGIHLLGRNMEISYIGSPVEVDHYGATRVTRTAVTPRSNGRYNIKDIAVRPHEEVALFLLSGGDSGAKMYVYNYVLKEWGLDILGGRLPSGTTSDSDFSTDGGAGGSFAIANDQLHIVVQNNGDPERNWLICEQPINPDNGVYVSTTVKTAWINLAGLQSYQRVYNFHILGEIIDPLDLLIYVYYDYNDTAGEHQDVFTLTNLPAGLLQYRGHLTKQKCQSIMFEFVDTKTSGGSFTEQGGYLLSELGLELGIKADGYRDSNAKIANTATPSGYVA